MNAGPETLTDLGWHNNPANQPIIDRAIARCREAKHHPADVDIGGGHRGLDHVVTCLSCGYKYHYDSSD